ncbi:hypothetical protein GCM10023189_20030 [Nibrella saemangeumensis]|uniref:PDZ domain-containing protein n=1 Tax=Nibrella saemangeumensis TaxID=1084526 RepID=A0ABP8MS08_9BACT
MHWLYRCLPLIGLLLIQGSSAFAQPAYTNEQYNRLADAGKLYGYVKYFHPNLQTKALRWDSAFAAAVPAVLATRNRSEYAAVLIKLLSVLDDPLTTVLTASPAGTPKPSPITYRIVDSTLYVDLTHYEALRTNWVTGDQGAAPQLAKALSNPEQLKGVVFDLRPVSGRESASVSDIETVLGNGGISQLYTGNFYAPSHRILIHKTRFNRYFQLERALPIRGQGKKDVPMVFIVNSLAQLPPLVVGLQTQGKAAIIQEEGAGDITGSEYRYYGADSVLIRLRRSELVSQNGSTGITPTLTYKPADAATLPTKAQQLIRNGFTYKAPPVVPIMLPVSNFDVYRESYNKLGAYPSLGYRVLAAAEIYTSIDLFFAYKHLMDNNWDQVYREMLPKFVLARDSLDYLRAVAEFNAHINDGHGMIGSPLYPKITNGGTHSSGIFGKMVEGQFIVNVIANDSVARRVGLKRGDVILAINGKKPQALIDEVRKYRAASNEVSQTYFLSEALLRGDEGETTQLTIKDAEGTVRTVALKHAKALEREEWGPQLNDRLNQPMLRFITNDIGYADLNRLKQTEVDSMFTLFKNTKAIIFDMRGYPNVTLWAISSRLTDKKNVTGALFTFPINLQPNLANIVDYYGGQKVWEEDQQMIPAPAGWIYRGKTVMLIDESAISQAEHTGLFLRAANGTRFIGSQTAGANGTAYGYPIPGGIFMAYTGHQSAYGDGKPMQRIGLKPDIEVRPTIKGIQQGRDEVLERAVQYLQTEK